MFTFCGEDSPCVVLIYACILHSVRHTFYVRAATAHSRRMFAVLLAAVCVALLNAHVNGLNKAERAESRRRNSRAAHSF